MNIRVLVRVAIAIACGGASPAWAGRPVIIDVPTYVGTCYLGATSCVGINITVSGVFGTAYVYREGIVSLNGLLPVGATSTNVASLGSGPWFAVGFSDANRYEVGAYERIAYGPNPKMWAFNFFAPNSDPYDSNGPLAVSSGS